MRRSPEPTPSQFEIEISPAAVTPSFTPAIVSSVVVVPSFRVSVRLIVTTPASTEGTSAAAAIPRVRAASSRLPTRLGFDLPSDWSERFMGGW
jgi:hypothetical protein